MTFFIYLHNGVCLPWPQVCLYWDALVSITHQDNIDLSFYAKLNLSLPKVCWEPTWGTVLYSLWKARRESRDSKGQGTSSLRGLWNSVWLSGLSQAPGAIQHRRAVIWDPCPAFDYVTTKDACVQTHTRARTHARAHAHMRERTHTATRIMFSRCCHRLGCFADVF